MRSMYWTIVLGLALMGLGALLGISSGAAAISAVICQVGFAVTNAIQQLED